jgi:hypothetical protein
MRRGGLELTISVPERANTFLAYDRATTVIGKSYNELSSLYTEGTEMKVATIIIIG